MNKTGMGERVEALKAEASVALEEAETVQQLDDVRVRFLGKKSELAELRKGIGALDKAERPAVGKLLTDLQRSLTGGIETRLEEIGRQERARQLQNETIDISLPGRAPSFGSEHPISQTMRRMIEIFQSLGFETIEGPEVETEYYNFEALNTPAEHPARDMQDTFYVDCADSGGKPYLLRSHTSPMQVRYMEQNSPPLRIVVPGRVYRRDADPTHSPMFHQLEGLAVGEGLRFSDLKGVLSVFVQEMFGAGAETRIRFRPSFFPFTEPTAEVDFPFYDKDENSRGSKGTRWLEILGSGMVDPEVFKAVGYDPERYTGFAFGIGIDRLAMLKYGIPHIRILYQNDLRFLTQF